MKNFNNNWTLLKFCKGDILAEDLYLIRPEDLFNLQNQLREYEEKINLLELENEKLNSPLESIDNKLDEILKVIK